MRFNEIKDKKVSTDKINPQTAFALRRSRARHPHAASDLDALIIDYNQGQKQDRRDITRLDYENDQEQEDINRLDLENDTDAERLDRLEDELAKIKKRISQ